MLFYFALGEPHGIKLAIVNDDVNDYHECFNSSWNVFHNENEICQVQKASCFLVNSIDKYYVNKQFFSDFDEAYDHFSHGGSVALLHIKRNFSKSCNNYLSEGPNLSSVLITSTEVEVHIDRTEWGLASDLSHQIRKAYEFTPKSLLDACNITSKFLNPPLSLKKSIFGAFHWDFRVYITHTLVAA